MANRDETRVPGSTFCIPTNVAAVGLLFTQNKMRSKAVTIAAMQFQDYDYDCLLGTVTVQVKPR